MHAQYVTLGACDEVFGAPVDKVQEILDSRSISRLPQMPPAMLGIIDVRGQTIPVVDLRHALGFDTAPDTAHTRILVVTVERPGGSATLGIRADRVFEVAGLDTQLEVPAAAGGRWSAPCVAGIGRRSGGFVTVLDLDALLQAMDVPST